DVRGHDLPRRAIRERDGDIGVARLRYRHYNRVSTRDHVQQEVFAGKLRPARGNRCRIDQDVIAEEVRQNGEAAGGLHPQPLDALAGRGLDKRRPGAEFVGNPPRLLARRAELDLNLRRAAAVFADGNRYALEFAAAIADRLQGRTQLHAGELSRVEVDYGGILMKYGHDLVVHQHGTSGEAVPPVVFVQEGRSRRLCRALFG